MEYLYSLTVALFLTIALIPLLIRFSARMGLVDNPGAERKVHTSAMPRTGGLGIILGVGLPLLFLLPMEGYLLHFFIGCAIIVIFGLLDDRVELNYKWKLFGQSLAAIVVMSGGIVVEQMPFFGLDTAPVWISYPLTFVFLVGVVNGVNFSDGLDGLAAGTSIMALLLIFSLALQCGDTNIALVSLTIVGGVLGFLRYNTFPANIFMGDAGSQFLGFVIACMAIAITQTDGSPYSTFLPILILGIPIMDILQVVPVRVHKKLPLPGPDKEHFHHQLGKIGFRHTEVVAIIYVLQTILMSGAFLLRYEYDWVVAMFYAVFVVAVLGFLLTANYYNWQYRSRYRNGESVERRNNFLRRLSWYFYQSPRVISVMLGGFFLTAGLVLTNASGVLFMAAILVVSLVVGLGISRFESSKFLFRVVLYSASVVFAFWIMEGDLTFAQEAFLIGYLIALIVFLLLAIRMTRKQEFSLTTQDLLILLVLILVPQLPFDLLKQYSIGGMALVMAVLMYTSEFVINRSTRMVALASSGAIAGLFLAYFNT